MRSLYGYVFGMMAKNPPEKRAGKEFDEILNSFSTDLKIDQSILEDCQKTSAPVPDGLYAQSTRALEEIIATARSLRVPKPSGQ